MRPATKRSIDRHGPKDLKRQMRTLPTKIRESVVGPAVTTADTGKAKRQADRRAKAKRAKKAKRKNR